MPTKGTRNWIPEGVADYKITRLSDKDRGRIREAVLRKSKKKTVPESFYHVIEKEMGYYDADRRLAASNRPQEVKKQLELALDSAEKLNDQLQLLGGTSKKLIKEAKGDRMASFDISSIPNLVELLAAAHQLALELPTASALRDRSRLNLAIQVAKAVQNILEMHPSSTKEGLYTEVLSIILEVATGKSSRDSNDLARKALKNI
jgi:hypothetical protein